jgi:hypothetical protein
MEQLSDRILALIQTSPGLTDREITDSLLGRGAPQQQVNQTCRRLESRGRLSRKARGAGRIGNYPVGLSGANRQSPHSPADVGKREDAEHGGSASLHWSGEIQFDPSAITLAVPHRAGVYQILQSGEYPRYHGTTRILKIGKSLKDLCEEVINHAQRHTVANRLNRIRRRGDISVTVVFAETSPEATSECERRLLRSFEDDHWDLPVLNSQRGYERGSDAHYCEPQDGAV